MTGRERDPIDTDQSSEFIEQLNTPVRKRTATDVLRSISDNKPVLFASVAAILICVVGIGVAIVRFTSSPSPTRPATTSPVVVAPAQLNLGEETELARQAIRDYNENHLDDARKENPSAHPIPVTDSFGVSGFDEPEPCTPSDTVCQRNNGLIGDEECAPDDYVCLSYYEELRMAASRRAFEPEPPVSAIPVLDEAQLAELQNLVNQSGQGKPQGVSIINTVSDEHSSEMPASRSGQPATSRMMARENVQSQAPAQDTEAPAAAMRIARMTDRFYAVSDIALSSKVEGDVSLTVLNGVLAGAKLKGTANRADNYMKLSLTEALLADGRECAIQAVALDRKTTLAAVRSGVDHHIIYRYGFWGLGVVMQAIGAGASAVAPKETIITDNGIIVTEESDTNREIRVAIGELGRQTGEEFKQALRTPPTVYVDRHEEMGVFLAKSILSSDCRSIEDEPYQLVNFNR